MSISIYDSSLPLSSYELGSIHSFFVDITKLGHLRAGTDSAFAKHIETLNCAIETNDTCVCVNAGPSNIIQVVGVVVDRNKSFFSWGADQITVMFKTNTGEYILNKYPVRAPGVFPKAKKHVIPVAEINLAIA